MVVLFVVWVERYRFIIEFVVGKVIKIFYVFWRLFVEIFKEEGL